MEYPFRLAGIIWLVTAELGERKFRRIAVKLGAPNDIMKLNDIFTNGSHNPLPKPNATRRMSGDDGPWTQEHILGIIWNPCYAGIGPYPGLVPEASWIHAAVRTINQDGAEQFLVNMLEILRESFEHAHLDFGESDEPDA